MEFSDNVPLFIYFVPTMFLLSNTSIQKQAKFAM